MDKYKELKSRVEQGAEPINAIMELETERYTKEILEMLEGKRNIKPVETQINFKELTDSYTAQIIKDYLAYL